MYAATNRSRAVALTIAGSDSGGGAGIQADLKTFEAFGVFGTTAVTAITAQNTVGVTDVHLVPPEVLDTQIEAVTGDLNPAAVKTGMLATADHIDVVLRHARSGRLPNLVIDPVMVATSGDRLMDRGSEETLAGLLPHAILVTPNREEAQILTGRTLATEEDVEAAARELVHMGARAALLKGGHPPTHSSIAGTAEGATLVDTLFDGEAIHRFTHPRYDTPHTHGTGCTLSAAVAAQLARGSDLQESVRLAVRYVVEGIRTAPALGAGHGPLNHRNRFGLGHPSPDPTSTEDR